MDEDDFWKACDQKQLLVIERYLSTGGDVDACDAVSRRHSADSSFVFTDSGSLEPEGRGDKQPFSSPGGSMWSSIFSLCHTSHRCNHGVGIGGGTCMKDKAVSFGRRVVCATQNRQKPASSS